MDGKDNAFPLGTDEMTVSELGLTKREYFAALNMQGLLTKYNLNKQEDQQIVAQMAVELADELIKELNKQP